ncbi:MAG TPA: ATP-binding protein [Candidatus Acidoferrum sp.]|nr:ATP-binding protein [Candidatus Acidoferrum sp.]
MVVGWQQFGLLVLCLANISLGLLVISRDPKAATNRLFLCVVLAVAGWLSFISVALSATDLQTTVSFGRLGFAFVTPIPFTLICLFQTFRGPSGPRRRTLVLEAIVCGVFVVLSMSPWVVAGATFREGKPNFLYGPVHLVLGGYLVACLLLAIGALWSVLRTAAGVRRVQLQHLGLGIFLGGFGIVMTNLLIPVLWGTSRYSVFGPYFTLIFVSFAAHAIIRHRLMEVRFVVRKSVVYVSALAVSSLVFLTAAAFTRWVTGAGASMSLTADVAIALMVSILFQPLKQFINDSFNRYLYREPYNYQRTMREATRRLSTILDLRSLLDFLVEVVDKTLRAETVAVYVPGDNRKDFVLSPITKSHAPSVPEGAPLAAGSALLTFLRTERRLFVLEEPPRNYPREAARAVAAELDRIGGQVAFPLVDGDALSGILVVGRKLSGDPYHLDDVDLISTIVGQAAVAMRNANLYREIVLANERIENILETMESGVIAVTADEIVTMFNSAAQRITGLEASDVKGRPLDALPPSVAEPIRETLRDLCPRLQIETAVKNGARGLIPLLYSTSTMKDRSGFVFGVVGVFSDVSRLRELEEGKRRSERLASIGALAAGMAHEIKNPLVAIRTFAELLPERFSDDDFRNEFSQIVVQEVERIGELLGRLRGLTSPQPQQVVSIYLRELVEETLGLLRGQLEQTNIGVQVAYDEDSTVVDGDRGQLKQLLLNVFLNAIEAMPDGGRLAVTLRPAEGDGEQWMVLRVDDTGAGIPDAFLEKIFDPFVTTKEQGSGLGLSICRGIIEAHRGLITAVNNPDGRGATVTIHLPVASAEPPAVWTAA